MIHDLSLSFFTALGVVLGGSIIGSLSSIIHLGSPVHSMLVIARPIKLWAILVALGGTFSTLKAIDTGVWAGEIRLLVQQLALILSAFLGASVGYWLIWVISGGE